MHKESHLFFHRCNTDPRTTVLKNGISKNSRFSFEAFRFVEHRNQDKSSIYIHCILRLCEPDKCLNIINVSKEYHLLQFFWIMANRCVIFMMDCMLLVQGCNGKRRKRSVEPGQPTTASVSIGPLYTAAQSKYTSLTKLKIHKVFVWKMTVIVHHWKTSCNWFFSWTNSFCLW